MKGTDIDLTLAALPNNRQAYKILQVKWALMKMSQNDLRPVWYIYLNNRFQFLNNITYIFKYFFTYMYF